jgi:hypothetical protein
VTGGGPPEALTCTIGSSTLFRVLGVKPVLGDIWPEAMDFTRQYRVILSHRLWRLAQTGGQPCGSRPYTWRYARTVASDGRSMASSRARCVRLSAGPRA